ncbi:MAG TPA: histidine kinase, partial [Flavihumibacter sp.]
TAVVYRANNVIYSLTEDDQGRIWAASCGGLMQLNPETGTIRYYYERAYEEPLNKLYAIIKLRHADSLLVGTDDGVRFFCLRTMQWMPDSVHWKTESVLNGLASIRAIRYFMEDANGTVWVGTEGRGLARINYINKELETIEPVNQIARSVKHVVRRVRDLLLATNNGLLIYDDLTNKVKRQVYIRGAEASNVCNAIQLDQQGYIWISSNRGLYKLDEAFRVDQEYNTGNGLTFSEFNPTSTLADPEGRLYFGGMEGITVFYPQQLRSTTYSPAPVVTGILINSQELERNLHPNLLHNIRLNHKQNFLTIRFAVPNYSREANCMFSYRLKGLDDNWSEPSENAEAVFTSLPPGPYQFELRSANSDGVWSEEIKQLGIEIQLPWWRHRGLHVAVVLVLAGLISFAVRHRINKIRQEAILRSQMAELEIKGLHTQMNPHFIFNALNSIKEMIWKDDKRNASRYLSKFAMLIRTSLEHSRQPFISIQQCIDHLEQYLEMEKLRFDDFTYRIETEEEILSGDVSIAPMLVQPLVENAIWHGLRNKQQDRQLVVRFFRKGEFIICEVDDNGVGIRQTMLNRKEQKQVHKSVGLENIRERLAVLNEKYQMNCSLFIADKSELGTYQDSGTLAILALSV